MTINAKVLKKAEYALGIAALLSVLLYVFIRMNFEIHDPDIWLHLKAGELILQTKHVPTHDAFSVTLASKEWIDHSWLVQLVFFTVFKFLGPDNLILLSATLVIFSFLLLFFSSYQKRGYLTFIVTAMAITVFACKSRLNIRPENFSLIFFSFYIFALSRPKKKFIYLLPIVQIFWVNCHGFFILGPLLMAIILTGEKIRRADLFKKLAIGDEPMEAESYTLILKIFALTILASFINPYGLKGALYPLYVTSNSTGKLGIFYNYIQELLPIWKLPPGLTMAYYVLAGLSGLSFILNFRQLNISRLILWIIFFVLSLGVNRNTIYFNFIAFWALMENTSIYLQRADRRKPKMIPQGMVYILKYALLVYMIYALYLQNRGLLTRNYYLFDENRTKSKLLGVSTLDYPKKAADFILKNNISGNIFNFFNDGSYLIYRLYPNNKVFIDGRTELYGKGIFEEYLRIINADKKAISESFEKYSINTAVLTNDDISLKNLAPFFYNNPQWMLVYLDEESLVFMKNTAENEGHIKKLKLDLKKWEVPKPSFNKIGLRRVSPYPYINRAWIFYYLREDDLALKEAAAALKMLPSSADAYIIEGRILLKNGQYRQAFEKLRIAYIYAPAYSETLSALGEYYMLTHKYDLAVKSYQRLIDVEPNISEGYSLLSKAYIAQNDIPHSVFLLKKAVEINPYKAIYYRELGDLLIMQGEKEKAHKFFQSACGMKIDPDYFCVK